MSDSDAHMQPPADSESGLGEGTSSGNKRKRSPGSSANPDSSRAKKPRKVFTKRPRKPKKPSDWHMRKGEVPKEAEKTKVCNFCYIVFDHFTVLLYFRQLLSFIFVSCGVYHTRALFHQRSLLKKKYHSLSVIRLKHSSKTR
jgi:hypothetical protein